jgi:uncharacterized protein (DUF1697 family)
MNVALMKPFAAFIRAIGPETHRVMPQAELCASCMKLGLRGVKSHIASGNLYLLSPHPAAKTSRLVEKAISGFGLERPVFTRDAAALDAIIAANPFPDVAIKGPQALSVSLFDEGFDEALVAQLLTWPGPERIVVRPGAVYVDYANGQGKSKIAPPIIERRLKRVGTARNWNTILKMRGFLGAMEG